MVECLASLPGGGPAALARGEARVEWKAPEPAGDLLEAVRARELRGIAAAVEETSGVDPGDCALENRRTEVQGLLGGLRRVAARLAALLQALDVRRVVAPRPLPGLGLGADQAPADVGVERVPAHTEAPSRLGRVQPGAARGREGFGHYLI